MRAPTMLWQALRTVGSMSLRRRTTWAMILVRLAVAVMKCATQTMVRRQSTSYLTTGLGLMAAS
ncbi:hypothetical protein HKD37_04G010372 [Glycine soja]